MLEHYAMLANGSRQQAVLLKGTDAKWPSAQLLSDHMQVGSLSQLQQHKFGILLGSQAARKLGVTVGDTVEVLLPNF